MGIDQKPTLRLCSARDIAQGPACDSPNFGTECGAEIYASIEEIAHVWQQTGVECRLTLHIGPGTHVASDRQRVFGNLRRALQERNRAWDDTKTNPFIAPFVPQVEQRISTAQGDQSVLGHFVIRMIRQFHHIRQVWAHSVELRNVHLPKEIRCGPSRQSHVRQIALAAQRHN